MTRRSTLQLEDEWRAYLRDGSGAPQRVLLDNCFTLLLLASLPVLVIALSRRLRAEQRARQRLADNERHYEAARAAAAAAAAAEANREPVPEPEPEPDPADSTDQPDQPDPAPSPPPPNLPGGTADRGW